MSEPNAFDRMLRAIAPGWAARRERARLRARRYREARGYYDGATTGRRAGSFRTKDGDPNVIARQTLSTLRSRHRDLVRNNPYAKRAKEVITSTVVGRGISPKFVREGTRAEDIQRIADACLNTTEIDAAGRHTYRGLQSVIMDAVVESGEVLVRRRRRRPSDGLTCPVQFQILEADFLDTSKDGPTNRGGRIIEGVEFDAIGRRRAYHLYDEHPGSRRLSLKSRPIPARDIIHVYRTERPGQVRGIPWGASVLLRLSDFDDYEDAQLVRQKVAACFAGFIEEPFDFGTPGVETEDDQLIDTIEPGLLEKLPPGAKVTFADPPTVSDYEEYARVQQRSIASGYGVPYEALTGDLKEVSFSAGRMGRLEFRRSVERWQEHIMVPQACNPLMRWFLEAAELAGADTEGVSVQHVPPRHEMIDPTKEIPADVKAIRSGQKTLSQVILERTGRDPMEHLEELAEDMKRARDLGLRLESDPANDTQGGGGGGAPDPEEDSEDEEEMDLRENGAPARLR